MTIAHDYPLAASSARKPRARARFKKASRFERAIAALRPFAEHRLVQFALLGGLIFAVAPRSRSAEVIEVESERLQMLRAAEAARSGAKVLTEEKGREVDERALEDEILYREGIRLGLDRNDGIVRQRIVQKVLFLAEEMAGASRPADEAGLRAFFEANRARWAVPAETRFVHVYRHAREPLAAWIEGPQSGDPPAAEPSPVAPEVDGSHERIAASLGAGFADAIESAPVGRWSGPYRSAFGWHLVRVIDRKPAREATLDEVRPSVVEAYGVHRRQEATAAYLKNAFARYRVSVDGKPLHDITPSRRVAFRAVSSGED